MSGVVQQVTRFGSDVAVAYGRLELLAQNPAWLRRELRAMVEASEEKETFLPVHLRSNAATLARCEEHLERMLEGVRANREEAEALAAELEEEPAA